MMMMRDDDDDDAATVAAAAVVVSDKSRHINGLSQIAGITRGPMSPLIANIFAEKLTLVLEYLQIIAAFASASYIWPLHFTGTCRHTFIFLIWTYFHLLRLLWAKG